MRIENFLWEWNYIMLNKPLMRKIGIAEAAFLCELISARMRFKQDEFYFTQKEMEDQLWISESTQMRYTKKLQDIWLIKVEKKWIPAKNYYTINDDEIFKIIIWETSSVNLTAQATPDWSDYSNNKETKKDLINSSDKFEEFWNSYPKKVKKKDAKRKFDSLSKTKQQLAIDALKKFKQTDQRKRGYIPDPTTYINQERREDEIETKEQKPNTLVYH